MKWKKLTMLLLGIIWLGCGQHLIAQTESLRTYETNILNKDTVVSLTLKKSELTDLRKYVTTLEYLAKKYENNLYYLDALESKLAILENTLEHQKKLYDLESQKSQIQANMFDNELKRIKEESKLKQRKNLLNGIGIGAIGGTLI